MLASPRPHEDFVNTLLDDSIYVYFFAVDFLEEYVILFVGFTYFIQVTAKYDFGLSL